jgi:ABC-2 type transport system permease protein
MKIKFSGNFKDSKIWMLALRENEKLKNNKKAFLFLFLVPIIYTLLFGFLYSPHVVNNISTAIVNKSPSQLTRTIESGFEKVDRFSVNYYLDDEDAGLELMNKGEIDVLLVIPEGFTENIKLGNQDNILIGINGSNSIIGNSASSSAMEIVKTYSAGISLKKLEGGGLSETEAMGKVSPISSSFRPWFNPQYSYVNYLLLGIVGVALQQIILMSSANSFAREREEGTFTELLDEGYGMFEIVAGKGFYYFASGMFSLMISYLIAFLVFKIPIRGQIFWIIPLGALFYISVIAGGLIIALYSRNQVESIQISMLLAYPTFLLSGYTWPTAGMPKLVAWAGEALPLTHFAENVRKLALAGGDFGMLKQDVFSLMILGLIYVTAALFLYRRRLINEGYERYMENHPARV